MKYYVEALRNYAVFSGRARRKEYWMFTLFNMIFGMVTVAIDVIIGVNGGFESVGIVSTLYSLAVLIPGLSLCVRRLHDIGKRGTYIFLSFIPLVGTILLLAYMCKEGDIGANAYGEDPKKGVDRSAPADEPQAAAKRRKAHALVMIVAELSAFVLFFAVAATLDGIMGNGVTRIFFKPRNLGNLMMIFLPIALASVGASVVFSRDGFDFSIGGIMSLSAVVAASLLASGSPFAIPAAIAVALALGLINAVGSAAAKKAGFLVTIATAALARYLGMGLSDFSSIPLDSGRLNAAIGAAFWFVLALAVVGAAFATKGGKPKAGFARACSSAFPYLFSSLLACAAGVFMMYRLNCSVPGIGTNYEIYTVFAIALSGSVLGERRFNLPGVLLGSLLAAVMSNVFSLMNVPIHAQIISLGAVIVAWFCLNWLISYVMFPRRAEASIG